MHQQRGLSFDAAIKATATAELTSPSTLRSVVSEFAASGSLPQPSSAHRGKGNPAHPLHSPSEPTQEDERAIHRALHEVSKLVKHVAVKHIQLQLLEEQHIHVGDWTLRRWLHELGYAFGDKTWIGALTPQYRDARIRRFIWDYAGALRLQISGTHVIIYLDESYIHAAHQMKKGWHPTSGPFKHNETQGDADTGKRLIILHAMSRERMLDADEAVGSNFLHEQTPTAQFVFEAASFDDSDYHNTIDGEAFTLWVKNRLLPAFAALYPGKKMIIVMDNASYHRPRDFDWITSYKMTKPECASFLESQGLTEITVQREDGSTAVFPKRTWQLHGRNKQAPLLEDLQAAVKSHLQQHPGINKTKLDKLLQPLGHSIVWTPPFVPEVQPIELVWAYVKTLVAQQYTLRRTVDTTRSQTDDAFQSITPEMIQKRIHHCHKWIDAFMQTEEAGSLQAFGSLDNLVAAGSGTSAPADIESVSTEDALASADADMEED
jgi:transposase